MAVDSRPSRTVSMSSVLFRSILLLTHDSPTHEPTETPFLRPLTLFAMVAQLPTMVTVASIVCLTLLSFCSIQSEAFVIQPQTLHVRPTTSQLHRITRNASTRKSVAVHSSKDQSAERTEDGNVFSSMIANLNKILSNDSSLPPPVVETEEERLVRLKMERIQELELFEQDRAQQVSKDKFIYLFLAALQLFPLIGNDRIFSVFYFWGVAVSTVYLGGKQITLEEETVSSKSAYLAPIGASVSIGVLYLLIKAGLDPTTLYAVGVTLFGALAISDVSVPILRNLLPPAFAKGTIQVPKKIAQSLDGGLVTELPVDGIVTLALGLLCTVLYWAPVAMEQKFLVSNCKFFLFMVILLRHLLLCSFLMDSPFSYSLVIAWSLAMTSLGAISLGSFQTAAVLLAGLFCYDIFWVFGTDVMMTVATKVEAPVKFLYTAPPVPEGAEPRSYPFSVLGLGDIVIPGLFVRFMSKVDEALKPSKISYFQTATAAYAAGLLVCFGVNEITHAGQPALLYLDPACIGSALACGAANGQLDQVWNFEEEEATD